MNYKDEKRSSCNEAFPLNLKRWLCVRWALYKSVNSISAELSGRQSHISHFHHSLYVVLEESEMNNTPYLIETLQKSKEDKAGGYALRILMIFWKRELVPYSLFRFKSNSRDRLVDFVNGFGNTLVATKPKLK